MIMAELQIITNTGTEAVLDDSLVEGFRSSLRGELLHLDDAIYEDARRV